ncbi:MAG: hypothetical protein Ct9H300mP12_12430 [Acidimicrobiales bacterium]|nr:MAG: hypothetical protein Ct9H300mP12_12430 [Acidimicrobiales bacterium]
MTDRVRLEVDGVIATITNDNVDKHNAFDDEMDVRLFEILDELRNRPEVRAVVWRGEGPSWSSGRDVFPPLVSTAPNSPTTNSWFGVTGVFSNSGKLMLL